MLKDNPVAPAIPAADLARAKEFYEKTLGLPVDREDPGGILFQSGGSQLFVYPSQFAGTGQQTVAGWEVKDLEAEMAELRSRGITFEQYDLPEIKTDANGIAEFEGWRGAWFKDTEGNVLSLGTTTA